MYSSSSQEPSKSHPVTMVDPEYSSCDLSHVWLFIFGYDSQSRDLWNENIISHFYIDWAMVKQARKPK